MIMELEQLKQSLKLKVAQFYDSVICEKYTIQEQIILIALQNDNFLFLKSFFDEIQSEKTQVLEKIDLIEDANIFDDFVVADDKSMEDFVTQKIDALNNRQKQSIYSALFSMKF